MRKLRISFLALLLCAFLVISFSPAQADFPDSTTVYYPQNNTCYTEANNFEITTHNCKAQDADGRDITQWVTFKWKGGVALDTSWVFVYTENLTKGSLWYWGNESYQGYDLINKTGNITLNYVDSYVSVGDPTELVCKFGNHWNNLAFNITFLDGTSKVYCFNQNGQINATSYWLRGTYDGLTPATKYRMAWKDITGQVNYAGYNLLGNGWQYYYVRQSVFQPDETLETKWVFTPANGAKSGKWHIFGWKSDTLNLQQAIDAGQYIYQDPFYNSSWGYRRPLHINRSQSATDIQVFLRINLSDLTSVDSEGDDLRFLSNCSQNAEELYAYNVTVIPNDRIDIYLNISKWGVNHTYCMYYDNDNAKKNWNLEMTADWGTRFTDYTIGNDICGQDGWTTYTGQGCDDIDAWGDNCYDDNYCAHSVGKLSDYTRHPHSAKDGGTTFARRWFNGTSPFPWSWYTEGDVGAGGAHIWLNRINGKLLQYHSGGWQTLFSGMKQEVWYTVNLTGNSTHQSMCWSNTTWAKCGFNILNYLGNTGIKDNYMLAQDEQGSTDFHSIWDDTAHFNTTDGIIYSFGAEEGQVPLLSIAMYQPHNTTYMNNSIDFNITTNKPLTWAKVQLLSTNHTMTNQSGQWQYHNGTLVDGSYKATFWVNDTTGNKTSGSIWFTIDTTLPIITVLQPFNVTYANSSIDFNITLNEPADTCLVQLLSTNHTMTNQSSQWQYYNSTLADGSYDAVFYCNDTAGNLNTTPRVFTIAVPPIITIISPENRTYYANSTITLKWTSDEITSWAAYSLNSASNVSISGNTTFTAQEGSNHIILWANDTGGLMSSSDVWFTFFSSGLPWLLVSWSDRKPLYINTTTEKKNIQVYINVSYEPEMQNDMDDLRFASNCSFDSVLIDAYNESVSENHSIGVWLNLTKWGTNNTYCMYYGNPSAQSYWNGFATFPYFQDFENLTGDLKNQDGWTQYVGGGSSFNVGAGGGVYEGDKAVFKKHDDNNDDILINNMTTTHWREFPQSVFLFHIFVNGSDPISSTMTVNYSTGFLTSLGNLQLAGNNAAYPYPYHVKAGMNFAWTDYFPWKDNSWYTVNLTTYNRTDYTMCVFNATQNVVCKTGHNFYQPPTKSNGLVTHLRISEGGNGVVIDEDSWSGYDLMYFANITNDNLKYTFGSMEQRTPISLSISNLSIDSPVDPVENSIIQVEGIANATGDDFDTGNCSLYYPNATIREWKFVIETLVNGSFTTLNCTFDLHYYNTNGTYNMSLKVNTTGADINITSQTFVYNQLSAFALNETTLSFGSINIGQNSTVAFNATNTGNAQLSLEMNGTDMTSTNDVIGVSNLTFDDDPDLSDGTTLSTTFQAFTNLSILAVQTGYVNLIIPSLSLPEAYTGTITIRT